MSAQPLPFYGKCPGCDRPLGGANLAIDGLEPRCRHCWDSESRETDHTLRAPVLVGAEQIADAKHAMDRPLEEYVHLPFPSVHALVGAIPPGDVGFFAAFSGLGKTTFVTSAIKLWLEMGKRIYCLPLESQSNVFRTHLACKRLGYHAGMVLTGEYKRSQPELWPGIRQALVRELDAQIKGEMAEQLYISPTRRMDCHALSKAAQHAHKLGSDILIVDHIDHIMGGDGSKPHPDSVKVVDHTLDLTQDLGLCTFATTQVNHEGLRGDRLGMYQTPQPHHVYMGGKKRHVAAYMLGAGRPLKLEGVDRDTLAAARANRIEAWRVLEPNCMSVEAMKLRHFGERSGHKTYLRVDNGIVTEDPGLSAFAEHGINTQGRI